MTQEILSQCKNLSLEDIDYLIGQLRDLYSERFNSVFKVVKVYPESNIVERIKTETGFHCYHKPYKECDGCRGTHIIVIPIEKYSVELERELISRYDD